MAVGDVDSPDPIVSGSLGAACAQCFQTAHLLRVRKGHTAIPHMDPFCPQHSLQWSGLCLPVQHLKDFREKPLPL